jgi:hypothetical protein
MGHMDQIPTGSISLANMHVLYMCPTYFINPNTNNVKKQGTMTIFFHPSFEVNRIPIF